MATKREESFPAPRPMDEAHADAIYRDLASMVLELDADPLEYGPRRLNEKTAQCRSYLSRCTRLYLELSRSLHYYRRRHRVAEAAYQLRVKELLANDVDVRAGRSAMDREALAANALRADVEEIEIFAGAVQDLEAVLAVVRAKQTDLKDTQARLKDQTKLCLEEIGLGSRWRRKLPPDESTSSPVFDATPVGGSDARPLVVSESSSVEDLLDAALARTQSAETPPHERSELPDQVFDAALEELDAAPLETPAEQLERAPAAISESDLNQLLGALEDAP